MKVNMEVGKVLKTMKHYNNFGRVFGQRNQILLLFTF